MPHKSLYAPVSIPEVDIFTLLFEHKTSSSFSSFPDTKELLTDGQDPTRSYTRASLRAAATAFGRDVLEAQWGWRRGDVLAFYTPNDIDTAVLTCGCLWAGGVASPANPLYTVAELAFQLRNARARALVTQPAFLATASEAAARAGIPPERILLLGPVGVGAAAAAAASKPVMVGGGGGGGRGGGGGGGGLGHQQGTQGGPRHWRELLLPKPSSLLAAAWYGKAKVRPREDLAFLVYSSGTTGLPKGVRLTHYNVVANLLQNEQMDGQHLKPFGGPDNRGDRMLGVLPFFHIYGLVNNMFMSIYTGWQLVVMSRFDLEKACQLIQDFQITFAYVPPPIVLAFGKSPVVDRYDLTSLKMMHSGAAPLTTELMDLFWHRLKLPVKQGYGLSETSPVTHAQMPDEWFKFMGSVGKLVPNMESMIVDGDGREVPLGEEGELWVRGPNVFGGYFENDEKTAEAFSADGWFRTGDIFKMDKHGNFYCVDRLKELIKYKGFQVPPAELEGYLLGHQDVADACVIGIYDPSQATELPRAYVTLKEGVQQGDDKAAEIAEWVAGKVAPHKRLRGGVYFIDVVPKSPSGKILRRVMRDKVKQDERKAGSKL